MSFHSPLLSSLRKTGAEEAKFPHNAPHDDDIDELKRMMRGNALTSSTPRPSALLAPSATRANIATTTTTTRTPRPGIFPTTNSTTTIDATTTPPTATTPTMTTPSSAIGTNFKARLAAIQQQTSVQHHQGGTTPRMSSAPHRPLTTFTTGTTPHSRSHSLHQQQQRMKDGGGIIVPPPPSESLEDQLSNLKLQATQQQQQLVEQVEVKEGEEGKEKLVTLPAIFSMRRKSTTTWSPIIASKSMHQIKSTSTRRSAVGVGVLQRERASSTSGGIGSVHSNTSSDQTKKEGEKSLNLNLIPPPTTIAVRSLGQQQPMKEKEIVEETSDVVALQRRLRATLPEFGVSAYVAPSATAATTAAAIPRLGETSSMHDVRYTLNELSTLRNAVVEQQQQQQNNVAKENAKQDSGEREEMIIKKKAAVHAATPPKQIEDRLDRLQALRTLADALHAK